ncbi:ATP-dependent metallopeptidase FtsH/Yme1/Tma family protein [Peribacillus simplex]|uniref:ATP-dependent metallopeptidase FtsH/Yme1/Tma family protein n=1 Tax=Peribacillus simplex TaxID=1478 RepID=UPI00298DDB3A|nr:ATP-dependent metallopeptidase FtsH/Yme1/Tma family protein [Peribacillus simplex]MDW7613793.1 ATP-dependent metallopeptidase FtsH/Yme1/Tma family protein [Peribacillus simplex]
MKRIFRNKIFYLLIFLVTLGIVFIFNNDNEPTEELTEDEFFTTLEDGKVTYLELEPQKRVFEISGRLKAYEKDQYFIATVPNSEISMNRVNDAAEEHDIEKIVVMPHDTETSAWVNFFTTSIPIMIIFTLFFVILLLVKRMNHSK